MSDASEKYDQSIVVNPRTKERGKTVERIRDLKMLYKDTACLRFLGIEGQNYIDYGSVDEDTLHTLSITLNRPELWEKRALYQGKEGEVRYNMSSGIDQIEEEARQEGIQKGENLLAALINKLLSLGKNEDALKVTTDAEYRESLYIQYGLKKTI